MDTFCGQAGIDTVNTGGVSYDHILIPGGQCDSPAANIVFATNVLNDR